MCVLSLEFTRQAERIVQTCSRRTLEHPKCGAPTAAVPHSAFDGMLRLEAGGGVQLACGRCHRPAEPSRLRSAARVGWRRRAPCRPRTSFVLALGAKQPAPNTQCRVNCARRLIWPIRALRQQAAAAGSTDQVPLFPRRHIQLLWALACSNIEALTPPQRRQRQHRWAHSRRVYESTRRNHEPQAK